MGIETPDWVENVNKANNAKSALFGGIVMMVVFTAAGMLLFAGVGLAIAGWGFFNWLERKKWTDNRYHIWLYELKGEPEDIAGLLSRNGIQPNQLAIENVKKATMNGASGKRVIGQYVYLTDPDEFSKQLAAKGARAKVESV